MKSVEQFDAITHEYASFVEKDPFRNELHYPAVTTELGDVSKQRILDVGCGDGFFAEKLAEKGAYVVGYDKAPNLIESASKRVVRQELRLNFKISDPKEFRASEPFDSAVSVMVLPYAPDAKYLREFFASTARALKEGGEFVSVIFNPDFKDFGRVIGNRVFDKLSDNKVRVNFNNPETQVGAFTAELTQFTRDEYDQASAEGGFNEMEWKPLIHKTLEGIEDRGKEFWDDVEKTQPYAVLICRK